jgi:hypothetical protein
MKSSGQAWAQLDPPAGPADRNTDIDYGFIKETTKSKDQ